MSYISQHWDFFADEYNKNSKQDHTGVFAYEKYINTPSLLSLFPKTAKNVLDLGCGNGLFTAELTKLFPNVIAVDSSKKMLTIAKKIAPKAMLIQHNLEEPLPKFKYKFDLITAKLLLMYIEDLDTLVRSCYDSLNSGGVMLISVTHPVRWSGTVKKVNYFYEKTLVHSIDGKDGTEMFFIHRTLETYINTFRRHGLYCDAVEEPEITTSFMIEYPVYEQKWGAPRRLNLKFIKR